MLLSACLPAGTPAKTTSSPVSSPQSNVSTPEVALASTAELPVPISTAYPIDDPSSTIRTPNATNPPMLATSTPPISACLKSGGRVEQAELKTELLPDPLAYRVYLPPCYDEDPSRFYPVLYLIHGQSFNDDQWERLGVPETADRLIAEGELPPFIAVMPRDRVWKEPADDNFGEAVVHALLPYIDENYRTIPDRAYRAVGGLSRGAAWAVHLGLKYWKLFGAIGVTSGFVFHSDVLLVQEWLKEIPPGESPRIYLDIGNADRPDITEGAVWLEALLSKKGIPHEWHIFIGQHNEDYWSAHVEDYLRFYTQDWGW